jgi:signal transduction histidine kinase
LTALRSRLERGLVLAEQDEGLSLVLQQSIGNVDQTLSIVTALLRIAEIEHVRRTAAFAAVDLAEIVQETTEAYRPVAEDRGIELALSITTPACGVGDRQLLIEALVNLVDNAVKFTPPGGSVTVALSGTPHRPEISVSDNGPGIPVELRSAVFQRFYRADTARSARGSGLGLSLVAAVAKLHRFAVEVGDNDPGCRITLRCWPDDTAIR